MFHSIKIGFGAALLLGLTALPALSLSLEQTDEAPDSHAEEIVSTTTNVQPLKPAFSEVIDAMRANRDQRMKLVFAEGASDGDVDLGVYVRMTDFRYRMLETVGNALSAARTDEEIEQAGAMAKALLAVPADPVLEDVFSELEESGVFEAACGPDGTLPGGGSCVNMSEASNMTEAVEQPKSFWVRPGEVRMHFPDFRLTRHVTQP